MRPRCLLFALVLASRWVVAAEGPDVPCTTQEPLASRDAELLLPAAAVSPAARDVSASNTASLIAATANSVASVTLSKVGTHLDCGRASFVSQSLIGSSPISKSSGSTPIASQDGLANASSIAYNVYRFTTSFEPAPTGRLAARDAICRKLDARAKEPGSPVPKDYVCSGATVARYLPDELEAWRANRFGPGKGGYILGASAKLGYQTFNYVDQATLKSSSANKTPWSASAYAGLQPALNDRTLYLAKYEHQNAYKDAASGTICPAASAAQVTCSTGALGAPKSTIVRLATLEFRDAVSSSLAFAVSYHHDFEARANSVEIPVYLFKDGKSGLSGGVMAGWRSGTSEKVFGVFVSAPFSLIP